MAEPTSGSDAGAAVTAAHLATLAAALAVLVWVNRQNWFFGDDWQFLTGRGGLGSGDLWRAHIDHWSTLPIIGYQVLVRLVGVHTMWPYLLWALLAHLGAVHLAWRTARSAGADPWIATALGAVFAVLGSGAENLTWTFQSTTNTAVLLGYAAVVLVDRPQPSTRRQVGAGAALLGAVMFSNVGVFLVLAVAALVLVRSGGWAVARVAAVPAGAFAVWYALAGRKSSADDPVTVTTLLRVPTFVADALADSLETTVGLGGAGAVLALALVAWVVTHLGPWRERAAALALALGAVALFAAISIGRYVEQGPIVSSRYIYLMVALLLPLLALALTDLLDLAPGRDPARIALVALLGVVVVTNIGSLRTFAIDRTRLVHEIRAELLATAWLAGSGEPVLVENADVRYSPELTVSQLRALAGDGRIDVPEPAPADLLDARRRLQVSVTTEPEVRGGLWLVGTSGPAPVPDGDCLRVTRRADEEGRLAVRPSGPGPGSMTVRSEGGPLGLTLRSPSGAASTDWAVTLPDGASRSVNDAAAGHDLDLTMPAGSTLVCGLEKQR